MTLYKIAWILGQYISRDVKPEEFEALVNHAQDVYFFDNINDDGVVYPFIKHKGSDNGTMPLQVNTRGIATLPSDFAKHLDFSTVYNSTKVQIERVENWEFNHRKTQVIEVPTREYPIATYFGTTIKFLPVSLQAVNFTYISHPPDVVYATTATNGMLEYDTANSVELLWNEHDQIKIIQIILSNFGIAATTEQIKDQSTKTSDQ